MRLGLAAGMQGGTDVSRKELTTHAERVDFSRARYVAHGGLPFTRIKATFRRRCKLSDTYELPKTYDTC